MADEKVDKNTWGLVRMDGTSKLYQKLWRREMNDLQKKAIEISAQRTELSGECNTKWTPIEKVDVVNSPSHYTTGKIEVIDFILDQKMSYLIASATKYLCRFPHKHVGEGGLDDLRKARWFIEKQIEEILKEEDIK